jgi:hypothetical protein
VKEKCQIEPLLFCIPNTIACFFSHQSPGQLNTGNPSGSGKRFRSLM